MSKPTSKVIQISTTNHNTSQSNGNIICEILMQALCQDGSIWDRISKDEWECILEAGHKLPEQKEEDLIKVVINMRLEEYDIDTNKLIRNIYIGKEEYNLNLYLQAGDKEVITRGFSFLGNKILVYYIDCDAVKVNTVRGDCVEDINEYFSLDDNKKTYANGRFKLILSKR